jgi:hypothetical protein
VTLKTHGQIDLWPLPELLGDEDWLDRMLHKFSEGYGQTFPLAILPILSYQ